MGVKKGLVVGQEGLTFFFLIQKTQIPYALVRRLEAAV